MKNRWIIQWKVPHMLIQLGWSGILIQIFVLRYSTDHKRDRYDSYSRQSGNYRPERDRSQGYGRERERDREKFRDDKRRWEILLTQVPFKQFLIWFFSIYTGIRQCTIIIIHTLGIIHQTVWYLIRENTTRQCIHITSKVVGNLTVEDKRPPLRNHRRLQVLKTKPKEILRNLRNYFVLKILNLFF